MDSVFEVQRQTHEEIERLERALAIVLSKTQTTQRAKLANEHKASQILDRITSRAVALNNSYEDEATRKAESSALLGKKADDVDEFYSRLGKIKEYHLKYPNQVVGGFELELAALVDSDLGEAGGDDDYEEEDRQSLYLLTVLTLTQISQHYPRFFPARRRMDVTLIYTSIIPFTTT